MGQVLLPPVRGGLFEEKQREQGSPSGIWGVGSKFWYTCDMYLGASWHWVGMCWSMVQYPWVAIVFLFLSDFIVCNVSPILVLWLCGYGVLVWFFRRNDGGLCGEVFEYGEVDLFHSPEKAIWAPHYVPHPTNYQHFAESKGVDRCAVLGRLCWMN